MPFVKNIKTKAYFTRYQVKFRRRRTNQTDYKARRALVQQDKNKYETPKYRLVVRRTNKDIICQIFSSDLIGDHCLCVAYSHELKRYGIPVGHTNYAAAYCTGLLLARRIDQKFGLGYVGKTGEADGKEFHVKDDGQGMKPFKAALDVGLAPTTTGARIFGALKGACDGGLNIPHKVRRFPGSSYDSDSKKWKYDPSVHREFILGTRIASYMRTLNAEEPEKYQKHFSRYIANGIGPDQVEDMYKKGHILIRRHPFRARDPLERGYHCDKREKAVEKGFEYPAKFPNRKKKSNQQRRADVKIKLVAMGKKPIQNIAGKLWSRHAIVPEYEKVEE